MTEIVYVSPLKALGNDIHRNLETPLEEVLRCLMKQPGLPVVVTEGDQFKGLVHWEKLNTFLDVVQRL